MEFKIIASYGKKKFSGQVQLAPRQQKDIDLIKINDKDKAHITINVGMWDDPDTIHLNTIKPNEKEIRHIFARSEKDSRSFIYKHPPHFWGYRNESWGEFAPRLWKFEITEEE